MIRPPKTAAVKDVRDGGAHWERLMDFTQAAQGELTQIVEDALEAGWRPPGDILPGLVFYAAVQMALSANKDVALGMLGAVTALVGATDIEAMRREGIFRRKDHFDA